MADLLAAGALLVAIVAILFSLWYSEIKEKLDQTANAQPADNTAAFKSTLGFFLWKLVPLIIIAWALVAVDFPDAKEILFGINVNAAYSAPKAIFAIVWFVSIFLALHTSAAGISMIRTLLDLNPRKKIKSKPAPRP